MPAVSGPATLAAGVLTLELESRLFVVPEHFLVTQHVLLQFAEPAAPSAANSAVHERPINPPSQLTWPQTGQTSTWKRESISNCARLEWIRRQIATVQTNSLTLNLKHACDHINTWLAADNKPAGFVMT